MRTTQSGNVQNLNDIHCDSLSWDKNNKNKVVIAYCMKQKQPFVCENQKNYITINGSLPGWILKCTHDR